MLNMSKIAGDDGMKDLRSAEQRWPDCGTTVSDVPQCKDCVVEQGLDRTLDGSSASPSWNKVWTVLWTARQCHRDKVQR